MTSTVADSGLEILHASGVVAATGDVAHAREHCRRRRVSKLALALAVLAGYVGVRALSGSPVTLGFPRVSPELVPYLTPLALLLVLGAAVILPFAAAGRSPHVLYRPEDIGTTFADVRGAPVLVEEVTRTLNLFLGFKTFQEQMGGNPRRAILFEGPPGTGKTYMAKAMAGEAGVPFLFVSSSAFQSMYYGQTNRKIRSYFKALRKAARREGGAIGFIEEIDAIGAARSGMGASTAREGVSGVVNELLIQLQSFDEPPRSIRLRRGLVDALNRFLPAERRLARPKVAPANVLVIGATNRAADLDPALLRPGRFDRSIYFDLPNRAERRDILSYYLARKAHAPELDAPETIDRLAAMTQGYSPVMLEHLLDEALVWALRRGAIAMTLEDIAQAKLTEELGLGREASYSEPERRAIAIHEAGHATVAYMVGKGRKLEVLSIVKRKDALGLLAHSDSEERFTKTRTEIEALIRIAMGGLVAEELFFGEVGSGPSGDLASATNAAALMVGALGMGRSLISFEAAVTGPANLTAKVLATEEGRRAVEDILSAARAEAAEIVRDHRHVVEALTEALLADDELVGHQITDVIEAALARTPVPVA